LLFGHYEWKALKIMKLIYLLGLLLAVSSVPAQEYDPVFASFKGTVYKIPARKISKGYTAEVKDYRQIAEIELAELNIPERQDSILIPGVSVSNAFGIVFTSTMEVKKAGRYIFSLSSDDGSRLYINKKNIINNDKLHKMREMRDTAYFKEGEYPVKVWYYQGVPDRYGLIFNASFLDAAVPPGEEEIQTFVFNEEQLKFDHDSYSINASGLALLDRLVAQLNQQTFQRIIIQGHTDAQGTVAYNLTLSRRRANALKEALATRLSRPDLEYLVQGIGEAQPIGDNATEEGRALNRRVVLKVE